MKNELLIEQYVQERKQFFSDDCRGRFIKSLETIHDYVRIGKIKKYSFPFTAFWAITENCNLNCSHCYASERVGNGKHPLMLSDAYYIVDNLYRNGIWEIVLEGGEPFIYHGIDDLIQYIKEKDIVLTILTNATLLDYNHINTLETYLTENDLIQVSLDGYGKYNDNIRGAHTYYRVMDFLKHCGSLSNKILINCVITESNIASIDKLCFELLNKTSVRKIHFSSLIETGKGCKVNAPQNNQAIKTFLQVKKKYGANLFITGSVLPDNLFYDYKSLDKLKLGCCAARSKIFINSQGVVYPCEHIQNVVGYNMFEKDIKDIWDYCWNDWSSEAYNISKEMYEKKQFIPFCPGSVQYAKQYKGLFYE